jgi:molybdopterin converting factor small subunit
VASITVRVKLYADLRRYMLPGLGDPQPLEMPEGSTANDVLVRYGVSPEYELTVGLNGELAGRDSVLHDGDEVMFLSPMEGGG